MKASTILVIVAAILYLFPLGITAAFSLLCFIAGFILLIIQSATGINSKKNYTAEARRACEKVTPKKKQNTTPPWEK